MFKLKDILEVANELNIDFTKFSLSDFITGINIELEHGLVEPKTNVTNNDLLLTAKICLSDIKTRLFSKILIFPLVKTIIFILSAKTAAVKVRL